jgi:hypothetical protein
LAILEYKKRCGALCTLRTLKGEGLLFYLYNITVCPTKNEPQQQGISFLERERAGCEREREGQAGQQLGIFKVGLCLGEIEP